MFLNRQRGGKNRLNCRNNFFSLLVVDEMFARAPEELSTNDNSAKNRFFHLPAN